MPAVQGKIAYFDMENSAGSVTKKRLVANGVLNLVDYFQDEETFSIEDDESLEKVEKAMRKLKPTLVVFDTLNSYMGGADTYKASEVTQTFKKFRQMAVKYNASVLVLRHLTKSTKEKALYRGQGSIAFAGLARVVITVGTYPEDPDWRIFAITKINVARPPKAMTFSIQSLPDTLKVLDRSKFVWGDFVDMSADEIVSTEPIKKGEKTDEIEMFIYQLLSDGEKSHSEVLRAAKSRNVALPKLMRLADTLGIIRDKGKGHKTKTWKLSRVVKDRLEEMRKG